MFACLFTTFYFLGLRPSSLEKSGPILNQSLIRTGLVWKEGVVVPLKLALPLFSIMAYFTSLFEVESGRGSWGGMAGGGGVASAVHAVSNNTLKSICSSQMTDHLLAVINLSGAQPPSQKIYGPFYK